MNAANAYRIGMLFMHADRRLSMAGHGWRLGGLGRGAGGRCWPWLAAGRVWEGCRRLLLADHG